MTSTISRRLTAIFIWQARPVAADTRDLWADCKQDGFGALESGLVTADHDRCIALLDGNRRAGQWPVKHDGAGFGECGGHVAAFLRLDRAHVDENTAAA